MLARQRAVLLGSFSGYELGTERQRLRRRGDGRARPRAGRHADLHRPAVRPRPREAHAAGRRPLRTDRARRPRAPRASATTVVSPSASRRSIAKRWSTSPVALPRASNVRSTNVALPSRSIANTVEHARPVGRADDERRRQQAFAFEREPSRRQCIVRRYAPVAEHRKEVGEIRVGARAPGGERMPWSVSTFGHGVSSAAFDRP